MEQTKFIDSIVARGAAQDFVATKLNIKVSEFVEYLKTPAVKSLIEANNGWLRTDVLLSKNDPMKHYLKLNEWTPKEVRSDAHSPDRSTDTPF